MNIKRSPILFLITVFAAVSLACAGLSNPPTAAPEPPPTSTPESTATPTAHPTSTPSPTPFAPIPEINFRSISLSQFHGNLLFDFPITFDIPTNFVAVPDAVVWMPQEHLDRFTDSVPDDVEFLRVVTSTSTGYDPSTDTFIGVPYTEQEKAEFESAVGGKITKLEQRKVGEYPIFIIEVSEIDDPGFQPYVKFNGVYIATLVGTNTVLISTLSSPENFTQNEFIWERLLASLAQTK